MKTTSETRDKTAAEAAGYIAGTLTGMAQTVMPMWMWITLLASAALIVFAFYSTSPLGIARAFAIYASLLAILIRSAVYPRRQR